MFWGQSGPVLEIRNHYWGRAGRDGVCGGDLIKHVMQNVRTLEVGS